MNSLKQYRQKLEELRLRRSSKQVLETKLHDELTKGKKKAEPESLKPSTPLAPKDHLTSKKAYKLRKKYGTISDEMYTQSIMFLRTYSECDQSQHHRNIVALYNYQCEHNEASEEPELSL